MPKNKTQLNDSFTYSMALEYALLDLLGRDSKWEGLAGAFQNPTMVRDALLAAVKRIRARFAEISTADARLQLTVGLALDAIERHSRQLGKERDALLEVLGYCLQLVAHLVGFDWMDGQPHRSIVYSQTHEELWFDDARRHPESAFPRRQLEVEKRTEIAAALFDQGLRIPEIARVMRLTEANVKSFLAWSKRIPSPQRRPRPRPTETSE